MGVCVCVCVGVCVCVCVGGCEGGQINVQSECSSSIRSARSSIIMHAW